MSKTENTCGKCIHAIPLKHIGRVCGGSGPKYGEDIEYNTPACNRFKKKIDRNLRNKRPS